MKPVPSWIHAPGEDGSLALALVNSLHAGRDGWVEHLGDAEALRAWAHERAGTRLPREVDVTRFQALRGAVRELLVAVIETRAPAAGTVEAINGAAAAAPGAPALVPSEGSLTASWRPASDDATHRVLAAIAADAIDLATGERRDRLIACGAPGCVRLLLRDHNRRRWCSTACGDRVRAARYYARHRAG